jgi:metal-responsive CopG/Arc/MetJ family transcriptional regulator
MKKETKKRICITIDCDTLVELDLEKMDTYSQSRGEVIDRLVREARDKRLSK